MCDVSKTWLQGSILAVICLAMIPLPLAVQGRGTGNAGGPVIVISSPWHDPARDILAAGGAIVGPESALFGVFAASDDPQFAARLSRLGYWSFRSGTLAHFICGVVR